MINGSDKYIKFSEIKNKFFLDALAKSGARWDGKQEYYFMWPKPFLYLLEHIRPQLPELLFFYSDVNVLKNISKTNTFLRRTFC